MKNKYAMTAAAVFACLFLTASTAHAGRPLDVDCDVLEATNDGLDGKLEATTSLRSEVELACLLFGGLGSGLASFVVIGSDHDVP